ncbi:ATP-dependent DNA ligase [Gordonia soli]|uniref:DNA ligase (ATP) n=1 Tax=Gordonia soli NBRC 108243 TaxID=1223545 RepID=M0QFH8_9ACTN|nr:ATP-dependent DNA ligase [Gordonia soli]GAC67061.1 ATP-dependent DNA ligase LigD [Gordonia soli NBRC 108243]
MGGGDSLEVDGHRISITNLSKVLYPASGTRKFEVIDYYSRIADTMLPHLAGRLITRKRWPNGIESTPFFEKDLPDSSPAWIARYGIEHTSRVITYPLARSRADLVWMAQMAALELHTPQWRVPVQDATDGDDAVPIADDGADEQRTDQKTGRWRGQANRLVLDLDPGPGVPLHRCAEVALMIRDMLAAAGLESWPVTSGGKGLHVYARFPRPVSPDSARTVARQIATTLAKAHPDEITASMSKSVRDQRVFIDWSQNSGSKTTLSPYSLRGREQPWVAAPRSWDELADPDIEQLLFTEVLERVDADGDLLDGLDDPYDDPLDTDDGHEVNTEPALVAEAEEKSDQTGVEVIASPSRAVVDLHEYRRKRDSSKTPEPFGDEQHRRRSRGDVDDSDGGGTRDGSAPGTPIFVIQEHHARRLHYDFRLERDGVLVSWAVPKNLPDDPAQNRLAVQTEDHPMDYAEFAGDIPAGEYGGGHVEIWDRGTYETEKWRDKEIIVRLHGERIQGRYALIRTGDKNWLAHLMSDEPRPILPDSLKDPRPMLATDDTIDNLDGRDWAFEGKWDGYRILLRYIGGDFRLTSRSGIDMTADFPELRSVADELGLLDVVLDGEVVAVDSTGRTNFTLLAARNHADEDYALKLLLFDILYLNGSSLIRTPWAQRRELLDELAPAFRDSDYAEIPPLLDGPGRRAVEQSTERNLEGVVAKRRSSTYQQGRRSANWRKHKNWSDIEVVIGGYRPGRGNRSSTIGSLLLGLPEETGLRYVGRVGTGFTDAQLRALAEELEPLVIRTCPFLDKLDRPVASSAVWVLPKLVGEVRFMDWTTTGHLRHPSWRGIRRDKLPGDL